MDTGCLRLYMKCVRHKLDQIPRVLFDLAQGELPYLLSAFSDSRHLLASMGYDSIFDVL
jgi:hypothetical protein